MVPFRWNIHRREQLGGLAEGESPWIHPSDFDALRVCASRVVAFAGDSDLAFVGRSPESLFDYLSGVLGPTSWIDRLLLLNVSMRAKNVAEVRDEFPGAMPAMREHLRALRLDPQSIVHRVRPVTLVDLVSSGGTFANLVDLLMTWCREARVDIAAVRRKLRFVGITWRKKTSPKTWRWQQHADWLAGFPGDAVKNVSIPGELWDYLGNRQEKAALSNPPWRWADPKMLSPPHHSGTLDGLRLALWIYDSASAPRERVAFTQALVEEPAMKDGWFRALVQELRNPGRQR